MQGEPIGYCKAVFRELSRMMKGCYRQHSAITRSILNIDSHRYALGLEASVAKRSPELQ